MEAAGAREAATPRKASAAMDISYIFLEKDVSTLQGIHV